jgi:HEPN domain-containing protein
MNENDVQSWLEKAEHDLGTAKITIQYKPEYYDTICFHCQQATEKYLKAYLIHLNLDFKSKHSLTYLLDLISQHDIFSIDYYEKASKLESYAVDIRYPDSTTDIPTNEELSEAIAIVEEFQRIILNKLSKIL